MGTLTDAAISTTYKNLVFQKTDNKFYYTNSSDVDTELTTFASPMTFSGKITATLGLELDNNIIYASDGGATITLDTSDNVAVTGDLIVTGNDIKSGDISSSTTALTLSTADVAIAGDLTVSGNDIKSNGGTTAITLSSDDVTVAGDLTITGASSGTMTLGADSDGVDRSIVFGHTTLKSIIGIDDDQDVFAINTDGAFEAANDFEIDASGNVTIKGDLTLTGGNITNAITLDSTLAVTGVTTLGANLSFSGAYDIRFVKADGLDIHDGSAAYLSVVNDTITIGKPLTCSSTSTLNGVVKMAGNTGVTPGAGIHSSRIHSWIETIGGVTKTSIYVSLSGLAAVATDKDVIGLAAGGAAYLGSITSAVNGAPFALKMTCLEAPSTGSADIDLYNADEATHVYDNPLVSGSSTEFLIVDGGGNWTNGMVKGGTTLTFGSTEYLYLVNGASSGAGTYDGGKFLIEIWGVVS